jgi:hypothetical protein
MRMDTIVSLYDPPGMTDHKVAHTASHRNVPPGSRQNTHEKQPDEQGKRKADPIRLASCWRCVRGWERAIDGLFSAPRIIREPSVTVPQNKVCDILCVF